MENENDHIISRVACPNCGKQVFRDIGATPVLTGLDRCCAAAGAFSMAVFVTVTALWAAAQTSGVAPQAWMYHVFTLINTAVLWAPVSIIICGQVKKREKLYNSRLWRLCCRTCGQHFNVCRPFDVDLDLGEEDDCAAVDEILDEIGG